MRKASQPPPRTWQVYGLDRLYVQNRLDIPDIYVILPAQIPSASVSHVDHMNPIPLYTQLADILREMIKSGELQPRSLLPSESYLQQEQGVSRGTVRMAISILRDEGLVVTISGRGTFVRERDPEGK
jgi:GntR family transcriptional regulator